ncbi:MAG: amidohydrolase [Micromonosporaceae bacterium]|nr:amidohydrolase [Micromonosporaceae bacterium]
MRDRGAPFVLPWSLSQTWEVFERNRIGFALLSNPVPGMLLRDGPEAVVFATEVNEAVTELVAAHPDRFGLFAALPMPHIQESLEQIRYAYEQLGADGVVLTAQSAGRYLGAPEHTEVLAELDRRQATVLVHPMMLPGAPLDDPPSVLADFLLDTTRAALNLMLTGTLDRYPQINFILAHAGGFLPYAASRVAALSQQFFGLPAHRFQSYLHRFYYDLALSAPAALPSLLAAVPASRILYGTDWSAAPSGPVAANTDALDRYPIPPTDRARIDQENALRILPRLAQHLATGTGDDDRALACTD